ncbi:cobalt abc transporter, permease protein cbiq [Heliomicrobium modesticaldum Ice1]|uniref:Cobalt abc transporter, permease protein cbiq n=1 Tax=Heliobacterium modesticaldum (strain ATCC 51547 / Ice1) TaxID=498761 RepID=B0TDW5_HELMI|nr:cobalt ECF transporter T component CbiQ [Heliomicrobium modesticaldum]ABZ82828.1 cobalt abc transporter, permease protein cbiq [Heliomicrobium modesticaldum Ice1]
MLFTIDQWAWANKLRDKPPTLKGLIALAGLLVSMIAPTPWLSGAITLLYGALLAFAARIPLSLFLTLMTVPGLFLFTGCFTVAFSPSPLDPVVQVTFGPYSPGISAAGLKQAGVLFFRSLGATASLYFLVLTTPMVDVIELVSRLRAPRLVTELMLLIYRFIFVLMETTQAIVVAQESRLGYSTRANSLRALGILAANLFVRSLIRSRELYIALSARGYEEELRVLPRARTPKNSAGTL